MFDCAIEPQSLGEFKPGEIVTIENPKNILLFLPNYCVQNYPCRILVHREWNEESLIQVTDHNYLF